MHRTEPSKDGGVLDSSATENIPVTKEVRISTGESPRTDSRLKRIGDCIDELDRNYP